ncbi:MAG: hypothetical protein SOI13_01625 [Bifidobacterium mongoliense]|jgi:hypothetical protein|uniref:hypothetical protein n=1 Tax=Bifidobacterium mongoliense TaxID=518643 RepID=UPI002F35790B
MTNLFEVLDPSIGRDIDGEGLVRELLDADLPDTGYPKVTVASEIGVNVNELADGIMLVYTVGPSTNIGYGRFRFPVGLDVLCSDPDMGAAFKAHLYDLVTRWPFHDATPSGTVNAVLPTGFSRVGPDGWNLARDVHVWSMQDMLVTALRP